MSSTENNGCVTETPSGRRRRDTGHAGVQRASPRRIVGLAIIGAGLLLVVSVFLDWGHIAIGGGSDSILRASVSGAGTVSVDVPQDDPGFERDAAQSLEHLVSHRGVWAAVLGVLVVAAGVAYLRLRPRAEAAIAVAVLGGVGSVIGLSYALDLRGMFSEALDLGYAHYSPGFGVVLACTVAAILIPLGVAAFVLEYIAEPPSARPRER
jgi:hypothetical protein